VVGDAEPGEPGLQGAYCRTVSGWVCAAFVVGVFSRRLVGWQLPRSLRALAEAFNWPFKDELVRNRGPWMG
jgi:hypothetical protein